MHIIQMVNIGTLFISRCLKKVFESPLNFDSLRSMNVNCFYESPAILL